MPAFRSRLIPKILCRLRLRNADQTLEQQQHEYEVINQLNELTAIEYPEDQSLRARIRAMNWHSRCRPLCLSPSIFLRKQQRP